MFELLTKLLDTSDFSPRWYCGNWSSLHGWLHVTSDLVIFAAYAAIPIVLATFALRRKDIPFLPIFWLFAGFILFCGTGHLIEATIFWYPWYRLSGAVKLITALISWGTVFALVQVTPKALALPGLARINQELQEEIHSRQAAQEQLQQARDQLELRVYERTAQLESANLELQKEIAERKVAEEQFRSVLESAPDAIVIINEQGRILLVNAQTEKLFGYSKAELTNQFVEMLIPEHFHLNDPGNRTASENTPRVRPMRAGLERYGRRANGSEFPVEISLSQLETSEGLLIQSAIRDVTERKHADDELQRAKKAAESASRAKSEFLANVSHEIRTPMNAIMGMTELTLDTPLNPVQRDNLEIVKVATDSLLVLIEDLLDFSRMEAGKLKLDPMPFDLRDLLGDVLKLLTLRAHAKGLQIGFHVRPDVPDRLINDSARLRQILVNIIGNAIKFTTKGEVALDVELGTCAGNLVELQFHVIDSGIGIPEAQREAIFLPFVQADSSTTRLYGGTGLGLAISSQLVESMGGRIWVDSQVGKGSTFHFTAKFMDGSGNLPKPICEHEHKRTIFRVVGPVAEIELSPEARQSPTLVNSRRPLRILVAEDHRTNQIVVETMLAKDGHTVKIVETGRAAVSMWENQEFDLILMDVQMSEMDGLEATQAIREAEVGTGRHIPVIAMTAHARPEDRSRCLAAGMDGYLSKPVKATTLRAAIEECFSLVASPPVA